MIEQITIILKIHLKRPKLKRNNAGVEDLKQGITIEYLAKVNDISPGTLHMNIQYLLKAFPDLKKQYRNNLKK